MVYSIPNINRFYSFNKEIRHKLIIIAYIKIICLIFFLFFLAVGHAIYHDGSSGGVIRIGIINEDGIERKIFYNTISGEPVIVGE